MKPQLILRLASIFTRLIDSADKPMSQMKPDKNPMPVTYFAPGAESPASMYVIVPDARNPEDWTVNNSLRNRKIAEGLTQNQAATLAQLLNIASPQAPGDSSE